MIDYIDDSFEFIEFPNQKFVDKYRKQFFNTDCLFHFDNFETNVSNFNSYINLNAVFNIWSINIQSMRYDIEIPLMFTLYYYKKDLPKCNNEIIKEYSKYDWTKYSINDCNLPKCKEIYKKLFDMFIRFLWQAIVSYTNKIKTEFTKIFNINLDVFKKKSKIDLSNLLIQNEQFNEKLIIYIKSLKYFLYDSNFENLRKQRNDEVHSCGSFNSNLSPLFEKQNDFIDLKCNDENNIDDIMENIKNSLELLAIQSQNFNEIVHDYFKILGIINC